MRLVPITLMLALASCQQPEIVPEKTAPPFGLALANETIGSLKKLSGDARVLMVCGPSVGRGFERIEDGTLVWIEDSVADGRMAFTRHSTGAHGYFSRDAGGNWIDGTADGADVRQLTEDETTGAQVWSITYASTGVTETHSIEKVGDSFVDTWTLNRPGGPMAPNPSSAKIFTSNCIRP